MTESRHTSRRFDAEPACARLARRWAAGVATEWGLGEVETLALLTSELATNAVQHARTAFEVGVRVEGNNLRVEVSDGDPRPPVPFALTPNGSSGRGLAVVQTLASKWGIEERPQGKTVWFELPAFMRGARRRG